jgi:hypothetical protein
MSLIEVAVAMAVLSIVGYTVIMVMIAMERSQIIDETYRSVGQELSRQSEMLKATPLKTLLALPATSTRADGQLNGMLCPTNLVPAVTWQRAAPEVLPTTGETVYRFTIDVSVNRLGILFDLSSTVVRSMERETRLAAP